jgi:hypothetical protein
MRSLRRGRGANAPPPGDRVRRLLAVALASFIVSACVIATVRASRNVTPRHPAPFRPKVTIAYGAAGQAVAIPSPRDRVLIYVSEQCRYCRAELASWEALLNDREASPKPTIVLSPGSTAGHPFWLPAPFRSEWIHDRDAAVAKALGIQGVPFTAVFGSDGTVLEAWAGANPQARRVRLLTLLTEAVEEQR